MRVFVTGGAGYIGSHTVLDLLRQGNEIAVYDNFSNSSQAVLDRVSQLANAKPEVFEGDIRQADRLDQALRQFKPEAAIHFAGLKAVGASMAQPLEYYSQNVAGSLELLKAMDRVGCKRIVFSSSATVYGEAQYLPFDEAHPVAPFNPYGRTKAMIEGIIQDWAASTPESAAVILRYFNPVGADVSGRIGEDPDGVPDNLMPFIAQVAVGRRTRLKVFGDDFDTRDGTGERDYIHVSDLARAHLAALDFTAKSDSCETINVGSGQGVTVLEMLRTFEKASGKTIPYDIHPRRPGDVPRMVASAQKAERLLQWKTKASVADMCATTWTWQSRNPDGYGS